MARIKTSVFDADKIFFTADLHLGHTFTVNLRGYTSKDEMHEDLIAKWNDVVSDGDDVFVLGDISFVNTAKTMEILGQLNGNLHLIRGNHDRGLSTTILNLFKTISDTKEIYVQNYDSGKRTRVFMSHYSHRVWNMSHYGAYHLYGHSHNSLEGIGRSMDVGLDTNNDTLYSWEEIDSKLINIPVHQIDHHINKKEK